MVYKRVSTSFFVCLQYEPQIKPTACWWVMCTKNVLLALKPIVSYIALYVLKNVQSRS